MKRFIKRRIVAFLIAMIAIYACSERIGGLNIVRAADETTIVTSQEIYHHHTGNSTNGGGCYSKANWSKKTEYVETLVHANRFCGACGAGDTGSHPAQYCNGCGIMHTHTLCMGGDYIERKEVTVDYISSYSLNCGCTPGTYMGKIGIKASTLEWTQSLTLTAKLLENPGNTFNSISYKWNTGATTQAITVTENGTYYCDYSYKNNNSGVNTTRLTYTVSNVDTTGPALDIQVDYPDTWAYDKALIMTISDYQSGLIDPLLRVDGGEWIDGRISSWPDSDYISDKTKTTPLFNPTLTNTIVYPVKQNGTYTIEVRDFLGNTTVQTVDVEKIDTTKPSIAVNYDDSAWTEYKDIAIDAFDDDESGLDDKPFSLYSPDKGWSDWSSTTNYRIYKNGTYKVAIRDNIERNHGIFIDGHTGEPNDEYSALSAIKYLRDTAKKFVLKNSQEYALENTYIYEFAIEHVDDEGPVITYERSGTDKWLQEGFIEVTSAVDEGVGLLDDCYRLIYPDGTETEWDDKARFTFTTNGLYTLEVRDAIGNVTRVEETFDNLDNLIPDVIVEYDDENYEVEKDIVVKQLSAELSDIKLSYRFYSNGRWGTWGDSNTFVAKKNGQYKVEVKDLAGNVFSQNISITKIDTDGIKCHITQTPEGWTNGNVTLRISAESKVGLADEPYSFDGGATFTSVSTKEFTQNESVKIWVKDKADRLYKKTIRITNIDKDAPKIYSIKVGEDEDGKLTVVVNARDYKSGIAGYSYDGNTYTSASTTSLDMTEHIVVKVKDNAGNITTGTATYEPPVEKEVREVKPRYVTYIPDINETALSESIKKLTITNEKPRSVEAVKIATPSNEEDEDNEKDNNMVKTLASIAIVGLLAGLGAILMSRTVKVYNVFPDGSVKYMGRAPVHTHLKDVKITIPDSIIKKSETGDFKIEFKPKYVDKNSECQVKLDIKAAQLLHCSANYICEDIRFNVRFR